MCQSELTEFFAELTEFAAELSEFSRPKQYSRNSIPPVCYFYTPPVLGGAALFDDSKSVSARPGPDPGRKAREQDGTRTGRDGPHNSGSGWVRNAVKQSTWPIWTGPLRTRDGPGTWTGPGSDPCEGLDGIPRDNNRLPGLSENRRFKFCTEGWAEQRLSLAQCLTAFGLTLMILVFGP